MEGGETRLLDLPDDVLELVLGVGPAGGGRARPGGEGVASPVEGAVAEAVQRRDAALLAPLRMVCRRFRDVIDANWSAVDFVSHESHEPPRAARFPGVTRVTITGWHSEIRRAVEAVSNFPRLEDVSIRTPEEEPWVVGQAQGREDGLTALAGIAKLRRVRLEMSETQRCDTLGALAGVGSLESLELEAREDAAVPAPSSSRPACEVGESALPLGWRPRDSPSPAGEPAAAPSGPGPAGEDPGGGGSDAGGGALPLPPAWGSLRALRLLRGRVADGALSSAAGMPRLESISVVGTSGLTSLEGLRAVAGPLRRLTLRLGLASAAACPDLGALSGLTGLRSLELRLEAPRGDVSVDMELLRPLVGLTALELFPLSRGQQRVLAGLGALESLRVGLPFCASPFRGNGEGLECIEALPRLERLALDGLDVRSTTVPFWRSLRALRAVEFHGCRVSRVTMEQLAHVGRLVELSVTGVVSGMKQAFTAMAGLRGLEALQLSAWALMGPTAGEVSIDRGVGVLSRMGRLRALDISGVEVSHEAVRGLVSRLPALGFLALPRSLQGAGPIELPGWDLAPRCRRLPTAVVFVNGARDRYRFRRP